MDKIKHKIFPATDAGISEALEWCQKEGHTFIDFTSIEVGEKVSMVYKEKSLTAPHPDDLRQYPQQQENYHPQNQQQYSQPSYSDEPSMIDNIVEKGKEYWIFVVVAVLGILFYFYRGG